MNYSSIQLVLNSKVHFKSDGRIFISEYFLNSFDIYIIYVCIYFIYLILTIKLLTHGHFISVMKVYLD